MINKWQFDHDIIWFNNYHKLNALSESLNMILPNEIINHILTFVNEELIIYYYNKHIIMFKPKIGIIKKIKILNLINTIGISGDYNKLVIYCTNIKFKYSFKIIIYDIINETFLEKDIDYAAFQNKLQYRVY